VSEPIKVGDLVILIRTCGCKSKNDVTGYISQVTEIRHADRPCQCCGKIWPTDVVFPIGQWGDANVPFSWVKRIPPLSELEGQPTQEDIKEPA
jgi:hypothetical protein